MADILFIDDDPAVIDQLTHLIKDLGHTPHGSLYPTHLNDLLEHITPDLILLDLHMPEIDGLTLLRDLKQRPDATGLPVIMLTGDTDEDNLVACFAAGAFDFVNKPVRPHALRARIRAALEIRAHINQLAQTRDQLTAVIDAMDEGLVTLDKDLHVVFASDKALRMLDAGLEQIVGKPAASVLGAPLAGPRGLLPAAAKGGQAAEDVRLLCPSGAVVPVHARIRRLAHNNAEVAWIISLRNRRDAERQVAVEGGVRFGRIVSADPTMRKLCAFIDKVAAGASPVLILGESGTGKELAARELHDRSRRAQGPLVAVNCGAVPEHLLESSFFGHERGAFSGAVTTHKGHFESAHGGTLFLDEIGELPISLQAKLLRALQEKTITRVGGTRPIPVDFRLLAATHRDLDAMVNDGGFRKDLYYRLDVLRLEIPPLRRRPGDIPLLAADFIQRRNKEEQRHVPPPDADFIEQLLHYDWPGNVRELFNALERAYALAEDDQLHRAHLPERVNEAHRLPGEPASAHAPLNEKEAILKALEEAGFHKGKAAALLGISPPTLYRKRKKYGI